AGATRPPMRWGVTYPALLLNIVVTMEVFLLTRNLLMLLLSVPVHGLSVLLCARDPRFFDLMMMWGRTRMPAFLGNFCVLKAGGYSPVALDLTPRQRLRNRWLVCVRMEPRSTLVSP